MKNRIMCLLLAFLMVLSTFPAPAVSYAEEAEEPVAVWYFNSAAEAMEKAETVALYRGGEQYLSAFLREGLSGDIQWQIEAAENLWVDIQGGTGEDLRVSYGMVASLLKNDTVKMRCRLTAGGEVYYSDAVAVTVTEEDNRPESSDFSLRREVQPPEPLPAPVGLPLEPAEAETVSEATVHETTAPAETVPETTVPGETVPETTVPEATAPEETIPETTAPEVTVPETTVPEQTVPATTEETRVRSSASAPPMLSAGLSDEDVAIYTITIEYVYADDSKFAGQRVALPYIAEVAEGGSLNQTVTSPNCMGYVPNMEKVDLVFPSVSQNANYRVTYAPAQVSYTVRHYQQNIGDDEYVWVDTTLASGYTEAMTSDGAAKDYTGFTALSHYHEEIAANSSTTIDIYYDRNYYLMSFDLGGGYGVDPIYARYGADLENVATPTRTGYAFAGWSLDGKNAVSLPKTIPAENRTYIALWSAKTTTYTIVYWNADLDDGIASTPATYSYWGKRTVTVASDAVLTPAVVGAQYPATSAGFAGSNEAPYFAYESAVTAANNPTSVEVEGDGSTVINVYYSRKVYEIRYVYAIHNGYNYQIASLTGDGTVGGTEFKNVNSVPSITDPRFSQQTEKNGNKTYYYISIRAEYGANIEEMWPAAAIGQIKATNNSTYSWGSWAAEKGTGYRTKYGNEHANIVGAYPVMSADMIKDPNDSVAQRMTAWWGTGATITYHAYHIYYQVLPGQEYDAEYKGKYYKLDRTSIFTAAHNGSTRVDPFEYSGFTIANENKNTQGNSNNYKDNKNCPDKTTAHGYCNIFYYDRNGYTLSFYNYNDSSAAPETQSLMFGQSLLGYKLEGDPAYPTGVEPGSLEFVGWYTTPECQPGTEVNWNSAMPASNLTLYAKWKLVTHDVKVYLTESDANQEINQLGQTVEVTHDALVPEKSHPATPINGEDTFIGWFFRDENGQEQAFSFATMAITQDMKIYAKWRSNVMKKVTVRYVVKNGDGSVTEIADTETLMLRVGATRTFEAKTGKSLYEDYRAGCFPTTATHSITPTAEEEEFSYDFVYVEYEAVPYHVQYKVMMSDGTLRPAYKDNGNGTCTFVTEEDYRNNSSYTEYVERHDQNDKAIVTELYVPENLANSAWTLPDAYVPNALKIQKIIVPGEGNAYNNENTIVFIYRYAPTEGLYTVNHYIQDTSDTSKFDLYSFREYVGTINDTASASAITIPGYTYSHDITDSNKQTGNVLTAGPDGLDTMSGTVNTDDTLELNFYYTVNPYPYQVMYLEKDTNRVLLEARTHEGGRQLTGLYGAKVTEDYVPIDGYDVDAQSKSIYIQQEAGTTASINTIVFYYSRKSADLIISKEVALDPDQAKEEGITQLPAEVHEQEFTFTIYCATGFHKSVYDATLTGPNGAQSEVKIVAGARTMTVTLKPGQEIAIHELAMGNYTVTETYVPGFRTSVDGTIKQTHDLALVTANQNVKVEFLNTFPFYTGDLVVRKNITKLDASDPEATAPYKVTVTLYPDNAARELNRVITWTDGDGTARTYTVPALPAGATDTQTHTFDVLVRADGEVKLEGTPIGRFTVEEKTQRTGYITDYYKVTYNKALHRNDEVTGTNHLVSGVVHGGHPTAVTFRNTYKKGTLTINKTVTQEYVNDSWQSDTFTFTVTGVTELPDGEYMVEGAKVTVSGGVITVKDSNGNDPSITVTRTGEGTSWSGSLTFENLPAGYYTVTESAAGIGLDKYTLAPETGKHENLLANDTTAATKADFTNTYKRTKGNLQVGKEVVIVTPGTNIDTNQAFTFEVTLKDTALTGSFACEVKTTNGTADTADDTTVAGSISSVTADDTGKLTFQLKHNQYVLIQNLPVGEYLVKELAVEGYDSSFGDVTDGNQYTVDPATITTGNTTVLNCQNAYPVYYSNLIVSKTVVTPADHLALDKAPENDEFTYTVSISGYSDKINLSNGISAKFYDSADDGTPHETSLSVTNDVLTFTLKHGQWVDLNLPACVYAIQETALNGGADSLADHYDVSFKVGDSDGVDGNAYGLAVGERETVAFTNTYKRHLTELTITKTGASVSDENQSFIFMVKSTDLTFADDNLVDIRVVVTIPAGADSGSVTLTDMPLGTYSIAEEESWSWRYSDGGATVTLGEDALYKVTVSNTRTNPYWLSGADANKNIFDGTP